MTTVDGKGQFLLYATEDGEIKIDVRLENETVWVTQADMAKLFQCSADNISLHLKNIYDDGELQSGATTEDFSVVRCVEIFEIEATVKESLTVRSINQLKKY